MENNTTSYSNFLYVFPTAVWVNLIAPEFSSNPNAGNALIYALMFLFIPAELFSSSLWQRLPRLDGAPSRIGHFQSGALSLIDIFRILSLTIFYSAAVHILEPNPGVAVAVMATISLGAFFILNFLWNLVESPAKGPVFSHFKETLIDKVKSAASPVDKAGAKLFVAMYTVFYTIHAISIAWIFPMLGFVLAAFGVYILLFDGMLGGVRFGNISNGVQLSLILLLSLQVAFKAYQIVVLTYFVDYMKPLLSSGVAVDRTGVRIITVNVDSLATKATSGISLRQIAEFRFDAYRTDPWRKYPGILHLSKDDDWDYRSVHVVAVEGESIIGVARLSPAKDGLLPVSDEIKYGDPHGDDTYELSRFVILPDWRRSNTVVALFHGVIEELRLRGDVSTLYADIVVRDERVPTTRDLFSVRRFERMGFVPIGLEYFDRRYACYSVIMKLPAEKFAIFREYIGVLSKYSKRHASAA